MNRIQPQDLADFQAINKALDDTISRLEKLGTGLAKALGMVKDEAAELEQVAKNVNLSTKEGRKENEAAAKRADQLAKAYEKLQEAENGVNAELIQAREDLKTVNRLRQLEAKQALAAAGSYDALSAEMSILKIRYKQLTAEQIKNTKEGQALTARINDINGTLRELDANVGVHTRNVGNYTDALADLPGILGDAGRGVQGLSGQFKALLKNPVVLVIGLITGALVGLFNAFKKTETGAGLLAKGTAVVNGLFTALGAITETLAEGLVSVFENSKEAIKGFGEFLISQVINRFKALGAIVISTGNIIGKLLKGDLDGAREAAVQASEAMTTLVTGLDKQQIEGVADAFKSSFDFAKQQLNDFTAAVREMRDTIGESVEASLKFEAAQKAITKANRQLEISLGKLQTAYELAQQRADDDTLSLREQAKASAEAQAAAEELARTELRIANNNLALINMQLAAKKGDYEASEQLRDQQVEALRAVEDAQRSLTLATLEAETQRRQILRDSFEQELDYAIDLYDARKRLLERQIGEDDRSFQGKVELYNRILELDRSSFAEQIKLVQDFTGQRVELNELAMIDDERIVRERLKQYELDEITTNRILEILKERAAATQDIVEIEKDLLAQRKKDLGEVPSLLGQVDVFDKLTAEKVRRQAVLSFYELQDEILKEIKRKNDPAKGVLGQLLGLTGTEEGAIKSSFDFAKQQLNDFTAAVQRAADARVAASDRAVQAAENEYNRQNQLAAEGLANRSQFAQQELEQAKRRQQEALDNQRRVQRQQVLLDAATQASSLATAVAKVFKDVPFPLNLAASALMVGSFVAAKAKAIQVTKQEFAEGGYEFIGGGTHASGRDTDLGFTTKKGKRAYAQRGEFHGIVRHQQVPKYRKVLPMVIDSMNSGNFAETLPSIAEMVGANNISNQIGVVTRTGEELRYLVENTTDTKRIESLLSQLVSQSKQETESFQNVAPGITRRRKGNWTVTVIER